MYKVVKIDSCNAIFAAWRGDPEPRPVQTTVGVYRWKWLAALVAYFSAPHGYVTSKLMSAEVRPVDPVDATKLQRHIVQLMKEILADEYDEAELEALLKALKEIRKRTCRYR